MTGGVPFCGDYCDASAIRLLRDFQRLTFDTRKLRSYRVAVRTIIVYAVGLIFRTVRCERKALMNNSNR